MDDIHDIRQIQSVSKQHAQRAPEKQQTQYVVTAMSWDIGLVYV